MRSKLLSFLLVIACAGVTGLRPINAQNPASTNDSNGSAVTAPAQHSDASHSAVSPSSNPSGEPATTDSQRDANNAVANDRGTVAARQSSRSHLSVGLIGLVGLLGLLGLLGFVRRGKKASQEIGIRGERDRSDYRRAA